MPQARISGGALEVSALRHFDAALQRLCDAQPHSLDADGAVAAFENSSAQLLVEAAAHTAEQDLWGLVALLLHSLLEAELPPSCGDSSKRHQSMTLVAKSVAALLCMQRAKSMQAQHECRCCAPAGSSTHYWNSRPMKLAL
jgi:hypothetical protein